MKRYIKSTIAALLALVIIISSSLPAVAVGQNSTATNWGTRDEVCLTLNGSTADDYYTGSYEYDVLSEKSKDEIFNSLRTLMRDTHGYKSTYNDCHYKANQTDCENNNGKVSLIYTSYDATMQQWNGWNREHVWPKSLGGNNDDDRGGGADMHHIRPSDAVVNSTRGNKKYGNTNGGKAVYGNNPASGVLGGYSSTYFEPLDNVKGDVARICLYVYVRWGSDWGANSITQVFQSIDVLLEWCELDPVDTWEMGRNDVIEDFQGNRNVFIDYPEYAWLIFGREVPSNMTTPSGEAKEGNSGSQGGNQGGNSDNQGGSSDNQGGNSGNQGGVDQVCTHETSVIKNQVEANCSTDGYSGDIYCASCDELLQYGEQIPANDNHSGDWGVNQDGICEKRCANCNAVIIMTFDDLITTVDSDAEKILLMLLLGSGDSLLLDTLAK